MIYLTTRNVMIAAVAVVVIGFLSIHEYQPEGGLVWNVLHGDIWLTGACPHSAGPVIDLSSPLPEWWECETALPYRWLLIAVVVAVSAFMVVKQRRLDVRH